MDIGILDVSENAIIPWASKSCHNIVSDDLAPHTWVVSQKHIIPVIRSAYNPFSANICGVKDHLAR
jgi:hypothetical protein